MKQLFLILAFIMGYCLAASADVIKLVPSAGDSTRMDTVVVSEISDAETYDYDAHLNKTITSFGEGPFHYSSNLIAIVALIVIFGLPLFIVAIVLWFRYKNKQARYRLAAEALASGKNIPHNLFKESEDPNKDLLKKGIKNTCLGIGLGVFLWILTEEEGLAAIGFLIFCIGIGEIITAYATRPKKEKPDSYTENEEKG